MKTKNQASQARSAFQILMISTAVLLILVLTSSAKTFSSNYAAGSEEKKSTTPAKDSIYTEVDELPVFPGGDEALLKFIAQNSKYPEDAKKKNITGRVIVKFVVRKDCTISDISIVKNIDPQLDAESLRVISTLPKFEKPAMHKGKIVAVYYMVPITFSLK